MTQSLWGRERREWSIHFIHPPDRAPEPTGSSPAGTAGRSIAPAGLQASPVGQPEAPLPLHWQDTTNHIYLKSTTYGNCRSVFSDWFEWLVFLVCKVWKLFSSNRMFLFFPLFFSSISCKTAYSHTHMSKSWHLHLMISLSIPTVSST